MVRILQEMHTFAVCALPNLRVIECDMTYTGSIMPPIADNLENDMFNLKCHRCQLFGYDKGLMLYPPIRGIVCYNHGDEHV